LEDLGLDGTLIIKGILKEWDECHWVDWSDSGYGQVEGVLNEVMNLRVSQNAGNFLPSWGPVSF
jgi:hypothetical protein